MNEVWVFHGGGGRFSSGIFTTKGKAENWILKNELTGILTCYPLNVGLYDWAIENSFFNPKKDEQTSPEFIQKFTSASLEHYHYEDGNKE